MISEEKKKIVIENYFKSECNINMTIHDAYVKGFERGLSKAPQSEHKTGRWIKVPRFANDAQPNLKCQFCGTEVDWFGCTKFCGRCGARLMEVEHD